MIPLNLKPHEARRLADVGTVTIIRPVKPQPGYPGIARFSYELHPFAPSTLVGTPAEGMAIAPESKVWVYEDHCGNIVGDIGECPLGLPETSATRICRLSDLTEEEAKSTGVQEVERSSGQSVYRWYTSDGGKSYQVHAWGSMALRFDRDFPDYPADSDPWVWVAHMTGGESQ